MITGSLQDRRRMAQDSLEAMARQDAQERIDALSDIISNVLGFTRETNAIISPDNPRIPTWRTPTM